MSKEVRALAACKQQRHIPGMILLGNSYPFSLIRRPARIAPAALEEPRARAQSEGFLSYWGHDNTRLVAAQVLGFDPRPISDRPAITLSSDNLPILNGQLFSEAWVISPDYLVGFRPEIGREVKLEEIAGWQVLRIEF